MFHYINLDECVKDVCEGCGLVKLVSRSMSRDYADSPDEYDCKLHGEPRLVLVDGEKIVCDLRRDE